MNTVDNDTKSAKYCEFVDFLQARVVNDKEHITHTRVGFPSGKYCIPDEDTAKFYDLYCAVCDLGYKPNLSEKQMKIGPLMIDFDFEFDASNTERQYTKSIVKHIVRTLNNLIAEYLEIDTSDIIAYVTEKDQPTIVRDTDEEGNADKNSPIKKVKDGFHICYIIPMTIAQRYMIYDKLKENVVQYAKIRDLPFVNNPNTIVDIATVHRNNWMMYGSRKTLKRPYSSPYVLTHIYTYELEEENINDYTFADIVERMSVRQFGKHPGHKTHPDKIDIENSTCQKYGLTGEKKISKNTSHHITPDDELVNTRSRKYDMPIDKRTEMARKLVALLSPERARGRDDWIRVCWTLHNINDVLYDDFIQFSKKGGDKFDARGCEKAWKDSRESGFSIASLHWWAQQDNIEAYREMIWDSVDKKFINVGNGCSVDVAKLVHELYKYRFQCAKIEPTTHKGWYEFQEHRWVHIDSASSLRNEISDYIANKYIDIGCAYSAKMKSFDGECIDVEIARKRMAEIISLGVNLKKTTPLNHIITECEHKFLNPDFPKLLNSNSYLLGFNNGVYDLANGQFRAGLPDDYVMFSVGYDWQDFTGKEPIFTDLRGYFEKVIPNPNIREYLLRQMASFARGKNTDQQFVFWTGTGCHSADTEILLYSGGVKRAADIRMGDVIMGDDSTPRKIRSLFSGTQDMYRVSLSDGSSYIGNAEHRMALKSMYGGDIRYDDTSRTYVVSYHKISDTGPVHREKYFRVGDGTVDAAFVLAHEYLNKKITKANVIKHGTIIPIKIIDYLNLNDNMKERYYHYRNQIEYPQRAVVVDPYKLGYTMGTSAIPHQYKYNSLQIRAKVLAGILDKFAIVNEDNVTIMSPHIIFMQDCIFLCRSLGLRVQIITADKIQLTGRFDTIPTRIVNLNKFTYMFDDIDPLVYEFTVQNIGKNKFYGFAVDGNERYILQNCIVTYNSNGKSLLMDLIKRTFGDYYKAMDPTVLTRKRGSSSNATPELSDKDGVRIIFLSEPEESDEVYSSCMKRYTSGSDEICARPLYGNEFTYLPQFKMVMVCNDLPKIYGKDEGTWRRIRVVPFEAEFVDGKPEKPNQFRKDKYLDEKMKTWCNAFIWMLLKEYYPKYSAEGLCEPVEVQYHTREYRQDTDYYKDFLTKTYDTVSSSKDVIPMSTLYGEFRKWYSDEYSGEKCPERKRFINYIKRIHKVVDGCVAGLRMKQFGSDLDVIQ